MLCPSEDKSNSPPWTMVPGALWLCPPLPPSSLCGLIGVVQPVSSQPPATLSTLQPQGLCILFPLLSTPLLEICMSPAPLFHSRLCLNFTSSGSPSGPFYLKWKPYHPLSLTLLPVHITRRSRLVCSLSPHSTAALREQDLVVLFSPGTVMAHRSHSPS